MGHYGAGLGVHHAVGAIQQVRVPVKVASKTRNAWIGFGRKDRLGNPVGVFALVGPLQKVTLPGLILGDGFLVHIFIASGGWRLHGVRFLANISRNRFR